MPEHSNFVISYEINVCVHCTSSNLSIADRLKLYRYNRRVGGAVG